MADQIKEKSDPDAVLRERLPTPVKEQPDPFLQTTGRTRVIGIALFALAAVVILAVVLYGLNEPSGIASTAPAPGSTAQSTAPAAGGHGGPPAPTGQQTTNNAKG
jgi:hypothetical protein